MIKLSYKAEALQPIFTGSDEDAGITKTLRREKVSFSDPIIHQSWFKSENSRRQAALLILEEIWKKIDFTDMGGNRRMRIWDEFSSKMLAATRVRNRFQFLNELTRAFNIRSLNNPLISELIQRFSDDEFLTLLRDEQQFLILLLRSKRQEIQEKKKAQDEYDSTSPFDIIDDESNESVADLEKKGFGLKKFGRDMESKDAPLIYAKTFDRIPYISGNSIRGLLRRLVMRDFCERTGIKQLKKDMYHQLFTGGNITDSTIYENIEQRERYVAMCPPIGLFGSAIGNMTIEGELKVGAMRPCCSEHKTGGVSFWELLGVEFGTRRDDSKLERDIKIIAENSEKDKPQQMKYDYEVFVKGTIFNHQFICTTYDPLIESAFWHAMRMFKANPFIGGNSAIGNGEIELNFSVEETKGQKYLQYLDDRKSEIQEYFAG